MEKRPGSVKLDLPRNMCPAFSRGWAAVETGQSQGLTILLPIPPQLWSAIESGEKGREPGLAMKLIWSFAKQLPVEGQHTRADVQGKVLTLTCESLEEPVSEIGSVRMSFSAEKHIDFLLSPLPQEIKETIELENLDVPGS